MHYPFPTITHMDQVLAAIKGRPEFVVAKRDGFVVINYFVVMPDTFPPVTKVAGGSPKMREARRLEYAMRRECRGLVFDYEGKVIARRFHKFFNVAEREETMPDKIDLTRKHVVLEKLDGSMITPIPITKNNVRTIRWGTKMGTTDVAEPVEKFVNANPEYETLAGLCVSTSMTPIFEWTSRQQRIIIDYPEDKLVLLAIRFNESGKYVPYNQMVGWVSDLFPSIPIVKAYDPATDMEEFINKTRSKEDGEGFVIQFEDGHMIKIKSDWYVRVHKAKEVLKYEKDVLSLIVNEKLDDVIPFLEPKEVERIRKYESEVLKGIDDTVFGVQWILHTLLKNKTTRKDFALKTDPSVGPQKELGALIRPIVFSSWDDHSTIRENVIDLIRRHTSSGTKVDHIRPIIGRNVRW